ncbi:MAG: hypothetical protein HZA05_06140 [Nitrospirae bacterium]|nr:hypothetical protein [Nitrospirota bacterium]
MSRGFVGIIKHLYFFYVCYNVIEMLDEKLVHDLIVDYMKEKFAREYKEITINPSGSPDLILCNYGLTLAVVEVETENSISIEKAEKWKAVAEKNKLFLMIPKNARVKATELLWQKGIGDKVAVGTYEIVINMP